MKTIKVYGQLAEFCGRHTFKADVSSPIDAVRFLLANHPGLETHMHGLQQQGMGFTVRLGKLYLTRDLLEAPAVDEVIQIAPVVQGGGKVGKFILGAGLFVLGGGFGILGAGGIFGAGSAIGGAVSGLGASLALGGIAELLTPTPKMTPNPAVAQTIQPAAAAPVQERDPKRSESYVFSGITNVAVQGAAIPLIYGEVYVGSLVVSGGLDVA